MTREEIIEYIKYNGRYTKNVKKRLKKLLKKYHPDNNKNDKDTILILYQIKKELEEGTLKKVNYSLNESKSNFEDISESYAYFIELLIKKLKNKRIRIDKKLEELYKKMNYHYEKINNKQNEMSFIDTDIYEIEEEINELVKIDIVDFTVICLVLIIFFFFLYHNFFFGFIILFLIIIEINYINSRRKIYYEKKDKLKQIKRIRKNVTNEYNYYKDKVTILEKDEIELKKEKRRINNDISYYNHQLNKQKEKDLIKNTKKTFIKK